MSPDSKGLRRYQASVERALGLFDATHEWADYIAFLSRLQKALHMRPEGDVDVPLKQIVAKHLAQCMNPSLPSGVHQKALEVYEFVFSSIGTQGLTRDLSLYLPGFAHTLAFASLSIRPLFLSLIDEHVLKLPSSALRPALKALILSLLPGLEEDTSEDFEATLTCVNKIRRIFQEDSAEGFFWQSLFLASITNVYRRSGVLTYLARYLPRFGAETVANQSDQNGERTDFVEPTKTVLSPEPGLLVRCFSTGLQDEQTLVQRGFLDLLVTHLPLNSSIFKDEVVPDDLDILVTAAMAVVLRRDMSLNRRLWTWFLGPDAKHPETDSTVASPGITGQLDKFPGNFSVREQQYSYMREYGIAPLVRCFLKLVSTNDPSASERARPFRIGLSLMDRWEIGAPIVQATFIPLMQSLYDYQKVAKSQEDYDELFRSANVFFDGVESLLIWSQIFYLVETKELDLVEFILSHFNLQEEEMLVLHIPLNAFAISEILCSSTTEETASSAEFNSRAMRILQTLAALIPPRGLRNDTEFSDLSGSVDVKASGIDAIKKFYKNPTLNSQVNMAPFQGVQLARRLIKNVCAYFIASLKSATMTISDATEALGLLIAKSSGIDVLNAIGFVSALDRHLEEGTKSNSTIPFLSASSIIFILKSISARNSELIILEEQELLAMTILLVQQMWPLLSPQTPQYHVEVSQSLWDLHTICRPRHGVESALMSLMVSPDHFGSNHLGFPLSEASLSRFSVLWAHMGATVKVQNFEDVMSLLRQPLLFAIDSLQDIGNEWLQGLSSLIPIYQVILQNIDDFDSETLTHLRRLQNVMRLHSKDQWQKFLLADYTSTEKLATKVLNVCAHAVVREELDGNVEKTALSIIRMIHGQTSFHMPSEEDLLLDLLTKKLAQASTTPEMQAPLLETLRIVVRQQRPNAEILTCLLKGILVAESGLVDKWVLTLCFVIPSYGETIFQIIIKVTEAFCSRLESTFLSLSSTYAGSNTSSSLGNRMAKLSLEFAAFAKQSDASAEKVMSTLLTGLEEVIAQAHEQLRNREVESGSSKSPEIPQGLFSNIITGNQPSAESNQMLRSIVNDRLTIVLCFQDFIRICVKIWSWGSSSQTVPAASRASFHYMSSKMRVRARRILENLLDAEAQECLETIIELWVNAVKSDAPQDNELVLRLLQTLDGARPRIMIPATFNAIYNRTNPSALDKNQKSTMSTHISALELLAFLIEYTKALEDDLLAEIWADCTTFLREVLGNPMPHRQILLRLLEFVAVLCSKMENTNFGEVTKMRKELGDICVRLFTAIFTVKPGGEDPVSSNAVPPKTQKGASSALPYLGPGNSVQTLCKVLPALGPILADSDRMTTVVSGIMLYITGPILRSKNFNQSTTAEFFSLLQLLSKSTGAAKLWRRDVFETFNDPKFFQTPTELGKYWLPIIQHLLTTEKQLMPELLARLTAPTTAGLMFGVGASAARTDADRRTQLNLKRIMVLILAGDIDSFTTMLRQIITKIEELLAATSSSSPSSNTRSDIYMLVRSVVLKMSSIHLSPVWPMTDAELRAVFSASLEDEDKTYNPSARLQAAKLLDLLLLVKPDEFQLHEWLYVTDTVDAIYPPNGWTSSGIVDKMALEMSHMPESASHFLGTSKTRKPWLCSNVTRTTAVEDIEGSLLRPFFSQLSIHAFEDVYGLKQIDMEACELDLLADVFEV